MRLSYHSDTDSLYIDFTSKPSVDSWEAGNGVVLDYDADGNVVGIDIDQASARLEINEIVVRNLPVEVKVVL